jgi:hypothetical protein
MRARTCSVRCRASRRHARTCTCVCGGDGHGSDRPQDAYTQKRFEFEMPLPFEETAAARPTNGVSTMRSATGTPKRRGIAATVRDIVPTLPQPFTLRQLADVAGYSVSAMSAPVFRLVKAGELERVPVPGKKTAMSYRVRPKTLMQVFAQEDAHTEAR